jgi:hypothetical protein
LQGGDGFLGKADAELGPVDLGGGSYGGGNHDC